jgi:hypothetical protein
VQLSWSELSGVVWCAFFLAAKCLPRLSSWLFPRGDRTKTLCTPESISPYTFNQRSLLLETLPRHKEFSKADKTYVRLKGALIERCFPQLEALKLTLNAKDIVEPQVAGSVSWFRSRLSVTASG